MAASTALLLTVGVANGWPWLLGFDEAITDFTRGWADPLGWPVDVAHALGLATRPIWSTLLAVVAVLTLAFTRRRAAAGFLALSGVVGVLVVELTKTSMGRARPPGAEQFQSDLLRSFPSGHAAAGIYVYLALGLVLVQLAAARRSRGMRWSGWLLVVLGPVIGLSRVVLGVHWPSDVLAGWAFGSSATLLAALLLWRPIASGWGGPPSSLGPASRATQVTSEPSGRAKGP